MVKEKLQDLKPRLREIANLRAASAVLAWDQATYLPEAAASARGQQLATLSQVVHQRLTDPRVGGLLDDLEPVERDGDPDGDDVRLLRVVRRDFEEAMRIPPDFLAEANVHAAEAYRAWARARPADDFSAVAGCLERGLDLSRRFAGFFPGFEHPCDPLVDLSDQGMTVAQLRPMFAELRELLVPLVERIAERPPVDDGALWGSFGEADQLDFARTMVEAFGYDFSRGRMDTTLHPFAIGIDVDDVRLTTRVRKDFLGESIFSTLHEGGHGLYEQGFGASLRGTPLAQATSSAVHESQSRLWENLVGRSLPFWNHYYPALQNAFPSLEPVPLGVFYAAINKVEPSLIRTDADELTYNLHVIIRFELELELLEGSLSVGELPEAWRERYQRDLGVVPETDREGVLQDVHWYSGLIGGGFQGYALGNVLSAQFFEAAAGAGVGVVEGIAVGDFSPLLGWLQDNVYRHGRKYTAGELVERATGDAMSIGPYGAYLREKFGALYDLSR